MTRSVILAAAALTLIPTSGAGQSSPGVKQDIAVPNSPIEIGQRQGPSSGAGFDPSALGQVLLPNYELGDWLRKRDQVIIPAGPRETSNTLDSLARFWSSQCAGDGSVACVRGERFQIAAGRLGAAAIAAPNCDAAARAFRKVYVNADPSDAVANAYDIACLGSFAARTTDAGTPVLASRPSILIDAETRDGLLTAVGLLEQAGRIICAGLIRPDRTFLTARHCIERNTMQGYTVRSASGHVHGTAVPVLAHAPWTEIGIGSDWAILKLPETGAVPVAMTNLVPLSAPTEVTVVAAYPYADKTRYVTPTPLPERALRFPRDGMCQALVANNGCLQLVCQTVRGFSGAPIVSARRGDGSYDVVGFVSGSDGLDTQCEGTEKVANSTFAVSSDSFKR